MQRMTTCQFSDKPLLNGIPYEPKRPSCLAQEQDPAELIDAEGALLGLVPGWTE